MTRTNKKSIVLATLVVLATSLVGVFAAAPTMAGTADASTSSTSPHGTDANYTVRLDNNQPGATTAVEHYASGLRKDMSAMHYIVLTSDAFQFDSCSSAQVRAFGIDRGNDDPGTETDESLLDAYKSITFEKNRVVVEFYKEDQLAGGPVGVRSQDQIVARGDDCITNPQEPGWYQITGKINGSTNDNTETDFSQSTTSHYVYVCDCENRQEAEEKLGPPPSSDGGGDDGGGGESTPTDDGSESTPTDSGDDSGGESTPTDSGGGESTPTDGGDSESTPTDSGGGGGESTATDDGGAESTATDERQGQGTPTTTGGTTSTDDGATTTTTGDSGMNETTTGDSGFDGSDGGDDSTPTDSGGQPGFGLLAALGALAVAGLLARRRID